MSSKLYDTLTAGQCRQAEALYHLVMQKAAPPWGLCLEEVYYSEEQLK